MAHTTDMIPPPPRLPLAVKPKPKWKTWEKVAVTTVGLAIAAGAIITGNMPEDDTKVSDSGGKIYAKAGWSIDRIVDFDLELQKDVGWSDSRASCASKAAAETFNWITWSQMSINGRMTAAYASGC